MVFKMASERISFFLLLLESNFHGFMDFYLIYVSSQCEIYIWTYYVDGYFIRKEKKPERIVKKVREKKKGKGERVTHTHTHKHTQTLSNAYLPFFFAATPCNYTQIFYVYIQNIIYIHFFSFPFDTCPNADDEGRVKSRACLSPVKRSGRR